MFGKNDRRWSLIRLIQSYSHLGHLVKKSWFCSFSFKYKITPPSGFDWQSNCSAKSNFRSEFRVHSHQMGLWHSRRNIKWLSAGCRPEGDHWWKLNQGAPTKKPPPLPLNIYLPGPPLETPLSVKRHWVNIAEIVSVWSGRKVNVIAWESKELPFWSWIPLLASPCPYIGWSL